ncbi:MAG: M3 family oligoendopeptidase [Rubricoccaceae bacterium]|nr:M3 family oligoendopeptidase [Rubricoccaceae bacterium]
MPEAPPTGAEAVRWTLDDLYADADALHADLARAETEAEAFAERTRGRLADLGAAAFADAMETLAGLHDRTGRAYTYAYLHWSTATEDASRGALLQKVREAYTRIGQHLIFFDVEWAGLDEGAANALLDAPELAPYRHHLELKREAREHVLSEPEERVLAEKAVTGWSAWNRFFDETLGAARFTYRGETLPLQQVLAKLHEPDREVREDAHRAVTEGLVALRRPLTYVFNTVLADHASTDRLRGYDHWLASRNESNEITRESVDALVEAVTGRYDLVHRFYDLKRRLLGLDTLYDYDRYAPLAEAGETYDWDRARETVLDAYGAFDPEMGEIAGRFFDGGWIDAPPEPGKRGGAFSHGAVPSAHPYILLNYTGKVRDVQTLAHELGHGVHQYLSRGQGVFHADTPLTTAETASVFGEMLVFQRLLGAAVAEDRLALLVEKIDDTMATVFRQVTMNRFEERVHTHRRTEGELSSEAFGRHWMATQRAMYGEAVTLTEGYTHWWSYIPHFVHTPGYVYAYAFGELLVLALYQRYQEEGDTFPPKYRDLLAAGGSDWPHVLVGRLGIDLRDPAFWSRGLDAVEALVEEAEALAAAVDAPAAVRDA